MKEEASIDENLHEESKIKKAFLEPEVAAYPSSISRVLESDLIVIGPGDLYTSIIPLFLVNGMKEALKATHAKIVYVVNLMTKSGQTFRYSASNHVQDIEKYMGRPLDAIIMHNGTIDKNIIDWYASHNEHKVIDDMQSDKRVLRADIADNTIVESDKADKISAYARSILRHHSDRLASAVMTLL